MYYSCNYTLNLKWRCLNFRKDTHLHFSDVLSHLYKSMCQSVSQLVHPLVGRSIRPSVNCTVSRSVGWSIGQRERDREKEKEKERERETCLNVSPFSFLQCVPSRRVLSVESIIPHWDDQRVRFPHSMLTFSLFHPLDHFTFSLVHSVIVA